MTTVSHSDVHAAERDADAAQTRRLSVALRTGAILWFLLLGVGFFAPGGWQWGMPGPVGHMENYVISLWFVGLVATPLLASRDPLRNTSAVQVYALAILAIVLSTVRGESPKWISDAPPLLLAALTLGLVLVTHPRRSALWHAETRARR
jgi:peptidoglycan/LPS O-acetylase OafA/YrhL